MNLDQAGNSRSDARDLGTLTDRSALGDYEFSDFVGSNLGDSADYYEFQLDRPRQLSFALRGLSGNANVYLEDRNGTVLQSGTNSGTRDELKDYNLAANTTYYMRVASVGSDFTNYNLVLNPGNEVGSSSSGQVDLSEERFNVVQEPLNAGDSFDAQVRVRNRGSSNASSFRTGFYISTDSTITTSDRFLGSYNFSSLAAGNTSSTITRRLTLPSASDSFWRGSQNYYIGMIVDDQGAISETNESNNTEDDRVNITVSNPSSSGTPDLSGNLFNVIQEPLDAGDSFDAQWRVINSGSGNAGSFRAGFYLSTNSTISTSDRFLGSYNLSSLAAGSTSSTFNTRLTLPSASDSFWNGSRNYYIGMLVDDLETVSETNGNNNTGNDLVQIFM